MLTIADRELSIRRAAELLRDYPDMTLEKYDGRANRPPADWRDFSQADIDVTRVIEKRALNRDDLADEILAADLPWTTMPDADLDIADVGPETLAYDQLCRFYAALTAIDGVGPAIASKLMHLKWRKAMPIQDSFLMTTYRASARRIGDELAAADRLPRVAVEQGWRHLYLEAVRRDVVKNRTHDAFASLRHGLSNTADWPNDTIEELSDLRLLDMVMWADTSTS